MSKKKRYTFEMVVTGNANGYVDATSEEEAVKLIEGGEFETEKGSQETEWNLPDWGETRDHICQVDDIEE